jgi:N6-L-threonylcarbamoyladenine synthase
MVTLGIETSCDETSIGILRDGNVLHNLTYSQKIHARFGGVVPEVASRAHLQKVDRLCALALAEAGLTPRQVDLIAVTDAPGLAGALLVGISFALGLHVGYGVPVTGVNHIDGHISAIFLEHEDIRCPFLALVVSGGHTAIYRVDDPATTVRLGQTVDDAAGEAFDKVGRLLGFAYPAGPQIEKEAAGCVGDPNVHLPVAKLGTAGFDFSFSGLKTAAKLHLASCGDSLTQEQRARFCNAFQGAIVEALARNTAAASRSTGIKTVAVVGGVACNGAVRQGLRNNTELRVFFPSPGLCTDNGAMIARAGYERAIRGGLRFPCMKPTSRRCDVAQGVVCRPVSPGDGMN